MWWPLSARRRAPGHVPWWGASSVPWGCFFCRSPTRWISCSSSTAGFYRWGREYASARPVLSWGATSTSGGNSLRCSWHVGRGRGPLSWRSPCTALVGKISVIYFCTNLVFTSHLYCYITLTFQHLFNVYIWWIPWTRGKLFINMSI